MIATAGFSEGGRVRIVLEGTARSTGLATNELSWPMEVTTVVTMEPAHVEAVIVHVAAPPLPPRSSRPRRSVTQGLRRQRGWKKA